MEFKVVIYVIAAVLYFLYTLGKRTEEKKKQALPSANRDEVPTVSKPVAPPIANPLDDIMREIRRKQEEMETEKKSQQPPSPKPVAVTQIKKTPKEVFIKEKNKGVFEEGNYERDLTDEEKIVRGNLKIENEGIYKLKTAEEEMKEQEITPFQLNLRDAVIGSIILERKY